MKKEIAAKSYTKLVEQGDGIESSITIINDSDYRCKCNILVIIFF